MSSITDYQALDSLKIDMLGYVEDYRRVLETDPHNTEALQNVRDNISESLVLASNLFANLKNRVSELEYERKRCEKQRAQDIRNGMKNSNGTYVRGSATLAADQAFLDCEEAYRNELQAQKEYDQIRALVERLDQHLNSISSRLKLALKHDM